MSTQKACIHGEIRNNINTFLFEKKKKKKLICSIHIVTEENVLVLFLVGQWLQQLFYLSISAIAKLPYLPGAEVQAFISTGFHYTKFSRLD